MAAQRIVAAQRISDQLKPTFRFDRAGLYQTTSISENPE